MQRVSKFWNVCVCVCVCARARARGARSFVCVLNRESASRAAPGRALAAPRSRSPAIFYHTLTHNQNVIIVIIIIIRGAALSISPSRFRYNGTYAVCKFNNDHVICDSPLAHYDYHHRNNNNNDNNNNNNKYNMRRRNAPAWTKRAATNDTGNHDKHQMISGIINSKWQHINIKWQQ